MQKNKYFKLCLVYIRVAELGEHRTRRARFNILGVDVIGDHLLI